MNPILNIIWLVFGGFVLFLEYIFAGILACLLIVTIPVGVASFRMAAYILWPFGRTVVPQPGAGAGSSLMNFIWFIIAGWWLGLSHLLTALTQFLTIIGIPLGIANLKIAPLACFPFGKMIVPSNSGPFPAA